MVGQPYSAHFAIAGEEGSFGSVRQKKSQFHHLYVSSFSILPDAFSTTLHGLESLQLYNFLFRHLPCHLGMAAVNFVSREGFVSNNDERISF